MRRNINNIDDLKWEIARLTELKREQESYLTGQYTLLKDKVDKPVRILSSVTSSIPGFNVVKGLFATVTNTGAKENAAVGNGDWLTKVFSIGLPILLNRTFLKKSNWIKKALVLLASQTATSQLTQDKLAHLIGQVTSVIKPKNRAKKKDKIKPLANEDLQENIVDSPEDQILGI